MPLPQVLTKRALSMSTAILVAGVGGLFAVAWAFRPLTEAEAMARLRALGCSVQPSYVIVQRVNQLKNDDLVLLRSMPSLRTLGLGQMRVSSDGLKYLEQIGSVERLYLRGATIDDEDVAKLKNLSRLVELDLSRTDITDSAAALIAEKQYLRLLYIDDTRIGENGLATLTRLSSLESLRLSMLSDSGSVQVGRMRSLSSLHLLNSLITDVGLKHISQLEQLRELNIVGDRFTDKGLCELAKLDSLEQLHVRGRGITGDGLACFEAHAGLHDLQLSEFRLDESTIRHIAHIHKLVRLRLCRCRVSSIESLSELAQLEELEYVLLQDVQPAEVVAERLRELLPDVRIDSR